jgi:hypothetical protein
LKRLRGQVVAAEPFLLSLICLGVAFNTNPASVVVHEITRIVMAIEINSGQSSVWCIEQLWKSLIPL